MARVRRIYVLTRLSRNCPHPIDGLVCLIFLPIMPSVSSYREQYNPWPSSHCWYRSFTMVSGFVTTGLVVLAFIYALLNRFTRPSLSKIRGPRSSSFVLGGSSFTLTCHMNVDVVQAICSSCFNARSVKPILNGKGFMETSFASRPSLVQVQST